MAQLETGKKLKRENFNDFVVLGISLQQKMSLYTK
jgi:hypothetical protein